MHRRSLMLNLLSLYILVNVSGTKGLAQQLPDVPASFAAIAADPAVYTLENPLSVPTERGHLQGIQKVLVAGNAKLIMTGSSDSLAYALIADLKSLKTEQIIPLMVSPYRHAGGIQASGDLWVVGIEDNYLRDKAWVCLYPVASGFELEPAIKIARTGRAEEQTAGAAGLLSWQDAPLVLVANWNSRRWDFYQVSSAGDNHHQLMTSFHAPDGWGSYQSINLLQDDKAIYAIGLYRQNQEDLADLILVSEIEVFEPVMKKIATKRLFTRGGADFATAAGIEVDPSGKLHIWASQRDASEMIMINRFSEP